MESIAEYWARWNCNRPTLSQIWRRNMLLPLVALLGFATVLPLFMVVYGSFKGGPPGAGGAFMLDGYVRAWSDSFTIRSTLTTFGLAVPRIIIGVSPAALWHCPMPMVVLAPTPEYQAKEARAFSARTCCGDRRCASS